MAALFNAVITNPARFGFTNVTQPCLNTTTGAVCASPDTSLFWDPLHPTAAGHRLISAYALDTVTAGRSIAAQTETALGNANRQTRDLNGRLLALRTTARPIDGQVGVFVNGDTNFGSRSTTNTNTGFNIDGYTEQNGDILNLKVNPQELDSLIFNIGAQVSYPFKTNFGTISPYFAANFEHEFAQNGRQISTELVTQPGIPIRTKIGANDSRSETLHERDFIRLSTGFQTEFTNSLFVNLGYETIVGKDNFRDNYLNATLRYQF